MFKVNQMRRKFQLAAWIIGLSFGVCAQSQATTTDLASAPLASSSTSVVRPNILFTLDDSGSMAWNYLPDYAGGTTYTGGTANHCKVSNSCGTGEVPFQTNEYNGMAYNPRLTYQLPVNADGTLKAAQVSPWTAVKVDGYGIQSSSNINMTTGYPEIVYCNSGICKKNGIDTNNPFLMRVSVSSTSTPPDNAPVYALPGTLNTSGTVLSTLQDGLMNQTTYASGTIFNGTLDITTALFTPTLTGVSMSGGGSTTLSVASMANAKTTTLSVASVTNSLATTLAVASMANAKTTTLTVSSVSHSGSTVTVKYTALSPALASGDTVVVSGTTSNCSTGYKSGGGNLTIAVVDATHFTYTSTSGTTWTNSACTIVATQSALKTVTVAYTALTPALAAGDTVVVSGCSTGFVSGGVSLPVTVVDATHFQYTSTSGTTWTNSACTVVANQASTPTVTVAYTSLTPALASGDTVVVSGCSTGFVSGGGNLPITVVDASHFKYTSTSGTTWTNTACTIVATQSALTTVTVAYTALTPALATGDLVVVSGCSNGFMSGGGSLPITVVDATHFTYTSTSGTTWTNSACTVVSTKPNQTVTVAYTGTTPTAPALATGDTVVVSGATCDTGYKVGGVSLSVTAVDATHFTYVSTSGSWSTPANKSCTIVANEPAHTAVAPKISKSGTTVTVTLSSAPTPALANGSLVTITNATSGGTCDAGYTATSTPMTQISTTSFSYVVGASVGTPTNTSCYITQVATVAPVSPGISLSGTTVTVYKTAHGLVTGNLIQVSDGTSGNCDDGFVTNGSVTVTVVNSNTFTYSPPIGSTTAFSNCRIDKMTAGTSVSYTSGSTVNSHPYYFALIPTEYCDSLYLTNCVDASAPTAPYIYPAPVRFCKDDTTAALPPGDAGAQTSGSTINCQAKYSVGTGINFQSVRYGLFWRGDIVPTNPNGSAKTFSNEIYNGTVTGNGTVAGTYWTSPLTYSNTLVIDRSSRSDCAAAPVCTYAEEMTNFSNWYAYYGTRMQMMKSSAGMAFLGLDNRYRVGFTTINPSSTDYLAVGIFSGTQKTNWYSTFYAINPGNSTPLREGLANAGRYFAGKKPGVMTDDPMEYACQQNFTLITTDGYWNGTDSNVKQIDGVTTIGNYDNADSGLSKRKDGAYDGGISGATDTLADVAMYYYKTDLRNSTLSNCTGVLGTDVCNDIVPMTSKDITAGLGGTQHMTTFSLGLADGLMTYQSDYETATSGDLYKIKTGATGCAFSGSGTCNWPLPVHDTQTALDDLWHAAVNGRGTYYNARDPSSLTAGLSSALAGINVRLAAAAASSTSSPNITQTDRSIYSSTYRTTKWDGEVTAQLIDPITGEVQSAVIWSAQTQLDTLIHADTSADITSRHVYTYDITASNPLSIKDFLYSNLTTAEKTYFDGKCVFTLLSQCTAADLSASDIASGNSGQNLVQYLRGNQSLEAINGVGYSIYRAREHLLGDTVNARPAYINLPEYGFIDPVTPSYSTFKAAQTAIPRQGALYMGSNDGMLHAFNSNTGAEMWAYVPKIVMPNLYKLAEKSYATSHQYFVDGSPETLDIFVDANAYPSAGLVTGWHTILVGALGLGGRGFYALDVTDPANPIGLWEICANSTLCPTDSFGVAHADVDIGYSYGNPVITKRSSDGKWVVLLTSGYDNGSLNPDTTTLAANPGSGQGILFELDPVTGQVLNKTSTGSGTATSPSGLAKISPWVDQPVTNFTTRYVYGGDLNGDVWRFDLGAVGSGSAAPTVLRIASLKDGTGVAQSVTTRPQLGDPANSTGNSLSGTGNPAIFVATGRYLGGSDVSNYQIQSVYGIMDDLSRTTAIAAYIGNPRSPQAGFASFVKQYIYQLSATTRTTSTNAVDWTASSGWYADFVVSDSATNLPVVPSVSPGERVNIDPLLISGSLIVVTNVPQSSACTIGGTSWMYNFDFLTGQFINTLGNVIVAQKLGNALAVGIVVGRLPTGQLKAWVTTADAYKGTFDPVTKPQATRRASWRELQ